MAFRIMLQESGLPDYAQMMSDYHQAFARELKDVVAASQVKEGDHVIDLACGDGAYCRWLAERVGASGNITALDVSTAFLAQARRFVGEDEVAKRITFIQSDVDHPAVDAGKADVVWCAQSLYSLPDPVDSVRSMRRLARPGGSVAVFESDEFHHLMLPWPIELEIAIKQAELKAFRAESGDSQRFYVGRSLPSLFREAGLPDCEMHCFAFHRQAPLDEASRAFVSAYLDELRGRVTPLLKGANRDRFEALSDRRSDCFMLSDEDFGFTCLEHLATARAPITAS